MLKKEDFPKKITSIHGLDFPKLILSSDKNFNNFFEHYLHFFVKPASNFKDKLHLTNEDFISQIKEIVLNRLSSYEGRNNSSLGTYLYTMIRFDFMQLYYNYRKEFIHIELNENIIIPYGKNEEFNYSGLTDLECALADYIFDRKKPLFKITKGLFSKYLNDRNIEYEYTYDLEKLKISFSQKIINRFRDNAEIQVKYINAVSQFIPFYPKRIKKKKYMYRKSKKIKV